MNRLEMIVFCMLISLTSSCMQTVDSSAQLPPPTVRIVQAAPPAERLVADAPVAEPVQASNADVKVPPNPEQSAPVAREVAPLAAPQVADAPVIESIQTAEDNKENAEVQSFPVHSTVVVREAPSDDAIQRHRQLFRSALSSAKTFRSTSQENRASSLVATRKAQSAKIFEIPKSREEQVLSRMTTAAPEKSTISAPSASTSTPGSQQADMCANCPSLFMNTDKAAAEFCDNWEELSKNFNTAMDKSKEAKVEDVSELVQCKRTVKCKEPRMIVRWLDYSMCDVHKIEDGETFEYSCNGTHWFMHGYPIQQVICADNGKKL